jgi:hypothetical protein
LITMNGVKAIIKIIFGGIFNE